MTALHSADAAKVRELAAEGVTAEELGQRYPYADREEIAGIVEELGEVAKCEDRSAERLRSETATPGCVVLNRALEWLRRYVAYPSEHAAIAHALWIAHTHAMDAWHSTPRIAFLSPEPESGKTRALEVTEPLVPNPVNAVNVTPAYLFRKVGESSPTILYDEIDTVFGPKARENEEVRGLLNAGHRRGAVAGRCVVRGKIVETEEIPAYCAVALAGLGSLPDTILSRSVVIRMRPRAPGETVSQFRERYDAPTGRGIGEDLAEWIGAVETELADARPEMPCGITDRMADCWEPLLAIADAAGGEWPRLARDAAEALVAESRDSTPSLGVRLLQDLRTVFDGYQSMATAEILRALNAMEEAPWGNLKGHPLDARRLALFLRPYGVRSATVRLPDGSTPKGYKAESLHDAWARYLPSAPSAVEAPHAPQVQHANGDGAIPVADDSRPSATSATHPPQVDEGGNGNVSAVADVADLTDKGKGAASGGPLRGEL